VRIYLRGTRAIMQHRSVTADMLIFPGVEAVDVLDNSTAFVPIVAWAWSLKKGGVEVDTSTEENPSFTSLDAGSDYTLDLTVTSIYGSQGSTTSDEFTVDPGVLATPTNLAIGTVVGFLIPLTFDAPADDAHVAERRLYYTSDGSTPDSGDSFVSLTPDEVDYDFTATGTGTWKFKLGDIAVVLEATDSALSSEASTTVSVGGSPPDAVTLDDPTAVSSSRVSLTWTNGATPGQHNIYRHRLHAGHCESRCG
jgi:hypothetical protein